MQHDPQRLRVVASCFNQLQGLVWVPFGAAWILNAVLATHTPYHGIIATPLQALVLIAAVLVSLPIAWYYRFLQRLTGLSNGNLSSHLAMLETAALVQVTKQFLGKPPNTGVALTPAGRTALQAH